MFTDQAFQYLGGPKFDINNIELGPSQVALFDSITGIGGIDFMPYDGATVYLFTGLINTDPSLKNFEPSLNNNLYYLVTNEIYDETQKDLMIALATPIPVILIGGQYRGSFVFNNPNDYDNLYLIWDYKDNLNSGTASYSGNASTKYINVDLSSDKGIAGVDYQTLGAPCRYVLDYNNETLFDTGYIGLNTAGNVSALLAAGVAQDDIKLVFPYDGLVDNGTGHLLFKKVLDNFDSVITVYAPLNGTSYILNRVSPYLNTFYIDTTDGDLSNVCSQTATTQYWHNGSGTYPVSGDTIYLDSSGATTYDGNDAYHLVSDTIMMSPPVSGGVYAFVNSRGLVLLGGSCDCNEAAVPFVYQDDIYLKEGEQINVYLQASGNPTSWSITTSCETYEITGGTRGTLWTYTDCYGNTQNITVGVDNVPVYICSSSGSPSIVVGDGVFSLYNAICPDFLLPKGLTFSADTGNITGIPEESCTFPITIEAANCAGTSSSKNINIVIDTNIKLTPFAIDVENFGDTGDAACAVSPIYSLLYHNGQGRVPDVNDTIYTDATAQIKFMGGSQWYHIDHSTYSIKICETGNVCDKNECPSVTTTTTSTTTTTTTTTLPTGDWFEGTLCTDPTVTVVLFDSTTFGIVVGDYVKTVDGNCWEITATTTATFPYQAIENPVVIYVGCQDCLGITTTTTTTTTTTAPVFTGFNMDPTQYDSAYDACVNTGGPYTTFYHNGVSALPFINDFVYSDSLGTTPVVGNGYWYNVPTMGGDISIQISSTGQVLDIAVCSTTTTTTTTTASTNYYFAKTCSNVGPPLVKIGHVSNTILTPNTVVKCDDGSCYIIMSNTTFSPSVPMVLFTYATCFDCTGITTTTTTTSTTTTTTTSSTTTTTTTTLPPLTGIFMRFGTNLTVCNGNIGQYYVDAPVGISGNNLYRLFLGNYIPANAGYYRQINSFVAYEWDGSDWTGNSIGC
jgi:hypothetical protein